MESPYLSRYGLLAQHSYRENTCQLSPFPTKPHRTRRCFFTLPITYRNAITQNLALQSKRPRVGEGLGGKTGIISQGYILSR
jgi:hypothetical protein